MWFFFFLSKLIAVVLLTILLMLHTFIFFNSENRFEDRRLLQYEHCHVVREPWEEGVCVCKHLPICTYEAVRV